MKIYLPLFSFWCAAIVLRLYSISSILKDIHKKLKHRLESEESDDA